MLYVCMHDACAMCMLYACMHVYTYACACMHVHGSSAGGTVLRRSCLPPVTTSLPPVTTVTTPYHPLPRFTPPYQVEKEQTKLLRAISHRLEKIEQKLDDQQEDIASLHSEQPAVRLPLQLPLQPSLQLPLYPAAAFAAAPVAIPATTHAPWNHLCSRVSLPCSYRLCVHISAPLQPA